MFSEITDKYLKQHGTFANHMQFRELFNHALISHISLRNFDFFSSTKHNNKCNCIQRCPQVLTSVEMTREIRSVRDTVFTSGQI